MSFFRTIWRLTPFYAVGKFIKDFYNYTKAKNYVAETFYSDAFSFVIKKYLKIDLKRDWIGRLYGIANPSIQNGKYDITSMIIEIDGDNTNNDDQVKQWAYKQLNLIATLFKIQNLYDYISLEFKHVGPSTFDNYLFIFDIASRKVMTKSLRYMIYNLFVWSIAIFALLVFVF